MDEGAADSDPEEAIAAVSLCRAGTPAQQTSLQNQRLNTQPCDDFVHVGTARRVSIRKERSERTVKSCTHVKWCNTGQQHTQQTSPCSERRLTERSRRPC